MLRAAEAKLLDSAGHREEALAVWHRLKERDPDSPCFMSSFAFEALGRYREAAAEWRYIISWLKAHDDALHTTWPKEILEGIKAKPASADANVSDNKS